MKISSLEMLPPLVAAQSTVFFDLDQTLICREGLCDDRPLVLTEPNAAKVVENLQARDDVKVVGLTARPFYRRGRDNAKSTETSLRRLGIDLGKDTPDVEPMGLKGPIGFREGCGYTGSRISKGDMLQRLRRRLPMGKIVFVDDRVKNLHDVALFAASCDIPCLAVFYTGALDSFEHRDESEAWQRTRTMWCRIGANCVFVEPHKEP